MTQPGLMSSSMPRTTPASARIRPSVQTDSAGPPTYTSAPPAVTPNPERWMYAAWPMVLPHSFVPPVAQVGLTRPPSTSICRFCRTLATCGPMRSSPFQVPTSAVPSVRRTRLAAPSRSGATVRPSLK